VYIDKPQLAHSKLAAAIIKDRFGVDDEDIINAISFHTTGREGMSLLEKIIYVADATEPNRTYKDAKRLNALAFKNLDQACFEVAEWSLKIIKDEGRYLDADTVKARDWFEKILKGNSMENSRKFAEFAAGVLSDRQGRDIVIIDIMEKSSFADYFVIATGSSERMINALAEYVDDKSAAEGRFTKNIEGRNGSGWVLMDYGDVVINIFSEENRHKYDLEKIWSDCEIINWEDK
jgi:ribosome silencing factor RsfS/YbeB/iojap